MSSSGHQDSRPIASALPSLLLDDPSGAVFRDLLEAAPDAMVIVNREGRIVLVNRQAEQLFGYTREEFSGQRVELVVPERVRANHVGHRTGYVANPGVRAMRAGLELYARHRNGSEFPVEISLSPMGAADGLLVIAAIRDISERKRLEQEKIYLQQEIRADHNFDEVIGVSRSLKKILKTVESVASSDTTVLLLGETGTGKELVARAVHDLSARRRQALVKVNCAAIPAGLFESELFGHEKGAFTGALTRRIGRFELADSGTIFLDEIGDLSLDLQAKLLRVLQEGEFERVGGPTVRADVRVIAATNRDLEKAMQDGRFRADLYYRLNVFPIRLPPLRERAEDVPILVKHFITKYGTRLGKRIETIPKTTMDALRAYPWPGNVRELENVIERAVILSPGSQLDLGEWLLRPVVARGTRIPTLEELERDHIAAVLELTGWRVSGEKGAARLLGLKPTTLEARMKKLGMTRKR